MDDYTFTPLPWADGPTDMAVHKTMVGYILSNLTNAAAVVMTAGGQVPARPLDDEESLSINFVLALQRYVGNAMWSMTRQRPEEWVLQGAPDHTVAMHSEFLNDVHWVASVLLQNARIGGYAKPADYDNGQWISLLEEFEAGVLKRIREFETSESVPLPGP